MDSKLDSRRAKAGGQVLVVAERLVLRLPTAAKSGARQSLDRAVLAADFDLAGNQQRPIADRRDRCQPVWFFLRSAVQPSVQQSAAWAPLHDLDDLVRAGRIRQNPRPPSQLKDLPFSPQALADMDADVQVEADLDIPPAIDLSHPPNIRPLRVWSREGRGEAARRVHA
jgi:hypothetical protein